MAWRGPHPMLLLVLLATWLALAWGEKETPFEKFQRQHVAPPRPGGQTLRVYCNRMMQNRNMTAKVCKRTNTFVHVDDVDTVIEVCGPGGAPAGGNLRDSVAPFDLTACRLQGRPPRPPCDYNGYAAHQRIRIACDQRGVPVHYCGAVQLPLGA